MANIFKTLISKGLPLLGSVLPIPGGEKIGSLIAGVLGCNDNPESIELALNNATPDVILKLKRLEIDHKESLEKLRLDYEKLEIEETGLHLKDRKSARDREKSIVEATGEKDIHLYVLSWVTVVGFFVVMIALIIFDLPAGEAAKSALLMLMGALITSYREVYGYFFGSSKSSSDKSKLLSIK